MSILLPMISIIIPCRNEEECLVECLESILNNDYPHDRLEIIIIDGMSTDSTRDILQEYAKQYSCIKVLDNPQQEQQIALNIGIQSARGDIIVRMDAHSRYKYNYISECVRALDTYDADNVGGRWITVPRNNTLIGRSICFATSVSFGVGNAYYRLRRVFSSGHNLNKPRWDINVAYFCCRREVFDRIGLFNEQLDRSEDIDFRSRLTLEGYRTLFVPSIECFYMMRTKFGDFLRHMFRNGKWVLMPLNYSPHISFSIRHIVPFIFIFLVVGALFFTSVSFYPALILLGIYAMTNLVYTLGIVYREKDLRYIFTMPWIFLFLHSAYGLGSVSGLLWLIRHRGFLLCFKRKWTLR